VSDFVIIERTHPNIQIETFHSFIKGTNEQTVFSVVESEHTILKGLGTREKKNATIHSPRNKTNH